jgi:hypothetical protein
LELDEVVAETGKDLDEQWTSMAERQRRSRSSFAKGSIHEEDVAPEVAAIRSALGGGDEVPGFAKTALTALGGDITTAPGGSFTVATAARAGSMCGGPFSRRSRPVVEPVKSDELDGRVGCRSLYQCVAEPCAAEQQHVAASSLRAKTATSTSAGLRASGSVTAPLATRAG